MNLGKDMFNSRPSVGDCRQSNGPMRLFIVSLNKRQWMEKFAPFTITRFID